MLLKEINSVVQFRKIANKKGDTKMVVGKDTYVSVAEADEFIAEYYPDYDDLVMYWGVLTDKEKTSYLYTSLQQIEALVLQGKPLNKEQPLQFPRVNCFKPATRENGFAVPDEVKEAQIDNALELFNADLGARSDEQMIVLSALGVVKNTKYNKREMGEVGLGSTLTGAVSKSPLESEHALKLLKAWH